MKDEIKFQIGKFGVTEGTIQALSNILRDHKRIRVSVLRGAAPTKDKVKEIADQIVTGLGEIKCDTKIIGFTIILFRRVSPKTLEKKQPKHKAPFKKHFHQVHNIRQQTAPKRRAFFKKKRKYAQDPRDMDED
jgi:RNA-binding protein YhbY